jgi:uncharacterized protein
MDQQGRGNPTAPEPLVIIGASARALAQSATAAGWGVHAADLFNDDDLRSTAVHSVRVDARGYPGSLVAAMTPFPQAVWCYTGAIENHPSLIDDLAAIRPLAGNAGATVRAVRDPALLATATQAAGLMFPSTYATADGLPRDGSFLVKPRASASGRGIHRWASAAPAPDREPLIWQRHVPGVPHAASFIITRGRARLLGLSRQLLGEPWCTGEPFAYGGSITLGSAETPPQLGALATMLGAMLAERFHLVGAVGVDLVIDAGGQPWIIEVNPRVTASMELHERSTGISIAAAHLEACGVVHRTATPPLGEGDGRRWAKAVLHTPVPLAITDERVAFWHTHAAAWSRADGGRPALADIPAAGHTLSARAPVLTVFARGDSAAATRAELRRRVAVLSTR